MKRTRLAGWVCLLLCAVLAAGTSVPVRSSDRSAQVHPQGRVDGCQIRVAPGLPTKVDPIQVTVSGSWHVACLPGYHSHQVAGNVVTVYIRTPHPGTICPMIACPCWWSSTFELGPLPAGTYEIDAYFFVDWSWPGPYPTPWPTPWPPSSTALCNSKRLMVWADDPHLLYLPMVVLD
jgi:hypothetical protein